MVREEDRVPLPSRFCSPCLVAFPVPCLLGFPHPLGPPRLMTCRRLAPSLALGIASSLAIILRSSAGEKRSSRLAIMRRMTALSSLVCRIMQLPVFGGTFLSVARSLKTTSPQQGPVGTPRQRETASR